MSKNVWAGREREEALVLRREDGRTYECLEEGCFLDDREDADNDGNGAGLTRQHESFNIVWILGWGYGDMFCTLFNVLEK